MGTKQYDSATDLITFSRASSATFLGSNGLLQTAANNIPRIEYDATGAVKGLLIEEDRTNLIKYSNTAAQWAAYGTTLTADSSTGPDGLTSMVEVAETATTAVHVFNTVATFAPASSQRYTLSAYVKKRGSTQYVQLLWNGTWNSLGYATFDLDAGTLAGTGSTLSTSITDVGGGVYRVSMTTTTANTNPAQAILATPNAATGRASSFAGNTANGFYVYGIQVEAGSFPTSYIPTTGAAATRARDIAEIPTSAFGYNNDKGTVVCEFDSASISGSTVFTLDGAGSSHGITAIVYPAGRISYQVVTGGAVQVNLDFAAYATANQVSKVATVYAKDDFSAVLNGGAVATDTTASLPTVGLLRLGVYLGGANFPMSGHIKSIQYYPRRLTNTQLQELTT